MPRPGHAVSLADHRQIALALAHELVDHALRAADAHEAADHQRGAVGDHGAGFLQRRGCAWARFRG
jgi:hypothetical protein